MYLEEAREQATQRVAHLLSKAMAEKQYTACELAKAVNGSSASANKQIERILTGETLPRIDTLIEMLAACDFDLVLSMKPSVTEEEDD